jgi:hypothetical protein
MPHESDRPDVHAPPLARQGLLIDGADPAALRAGIDLVIHYRGDATIARRGGADPLVGYVFDCSHRDDPARAALRVLPQSGGAAVTVPLADVGSIELTGRDTAEGKSFETWVRKYAEQRLGIARPEPRVDAGAEAS